jgi:guanylate kinase
MTLRYSTYMELDKHLQEKVLAYEPSYERLEAVHDVPLLFMVGISGAGKNTIMHQLLAQYPDQYREFVTHTTRAPRSNHGVMERDGVEYHFIDLATADSMLDNKDYIEANVYSGNVYGTSLTEIEAAQSEHRIGIGDIDVNGVANFVRLGLAVKPVFILPPSYDVWQQRLMSRYTDQQIHHKDWLNRMRTAQQEIQHALETDYYYLVVNKDLSEVVAAINTIAHGDTKYEHHPVGAVAVAQEILDHIEAELS